VLGACTPASYLGTPLGVKTRSSYMAFHMQTVNQTTEIVPSTPSSLATLRQCAGL
jgi:hypothetical protein